MTKSIEQVFVEEYGHEPYFQERIAQAVEKAKGIVAATDLNTEDAIINRMKYLISQHFRIPYHSDFFDNLTFDDLMLEVMLISESSKEQNERSGESIKENKAEAEDAFGDLIEGVEEAESLQVPEEFSSEEKEFIANQGSSFMQGGFAALK